MYGMVNKAIEGLVCEQFGEETWDRIVEEAGVEEDTFISLDAYDDAITYALVGAASKVLETPADQLLQAFGTYWTKYVGREGYGPLMAIEDKELGQFLSELNEMHTRIAMSMPALTPPTFAVTEPEPGTYDLSYESTRDGLAPMVIGLVQGIFELKELEGSIDWVEKKDEGHPRDVFRIRAA